MDYWLLFFYLLLNLFFTIINGLGLTWNEIKLVYQNGIRQYSREASNIIRFGMNVCFILSYALKLWTVLLVDYYYDVLEKPNFWSNSFTQIDYATTFYWLNAG